LTVRAAAALLGISEATFHNWRRDGRITGLRRPGGGRILYPEDEVLALRPGGSPKPPTGPGRHANVLQLPRGDQLSLEQLVAAGDIDRERAEAVATLLHPFTILSLERPRVRRVVGGAPVPEFNFDRLALANLDTELEELLKHPNDPAEVIRIATAMQVRIAGWLAHWPPSGEPVRHNSSPGGSIKATYPSVRQLDYLAVAAA
jgi:hypothetical protein